LYASTAYDAPPVGWKGIPFPIPILLDAFGVSNSAPTGYGSSVLKQTLSAEIPGYASVSDSHSVSDLYCFVPYLEHRNVTTYNSWNLRLETHAGQGRREGGGKGDMPPPEIAMLKKFLGVFG